MNRSTTMQRSGAVWPTPSKSLGSSGQSSDSQPARATALWRLSAAPPLPRTAIRSRRASTGAVPTSDFSRLTPLEPPRDVTRVLPLKTSIGRVTSTEATSSMSAHRSDAVAPTSNDARGNSESGSPRCSTARSRWVPAEGCAIRASARSKPSRSVCGSSQHRGRAGSMHANDSFMLPACRSRYRRFGFSTELNEVPENSRSHLAL